MDVSVSFQNLYVEAIIPNVTIFGDMAFKDVIKVKWGYKGGPNQTGLVSLEDKRRDTRKLPLPT